MKNFGELRSSNWSGIYSERHCKNSYENWGNWEKTDHVLLLFILDCPTMASTSRDGQRFSQDFISLLLRFNIFSKRNIYMCELSVKAISCFTDKDQAISPESKNIKRRKISYTRFFLLLIFLDSGLIAWSLSVKQEIAFTLNSHI